MSTDLDRSSENSEDLAVERLLRENSSLRRDNTALRIHNKRSWILIVALMIVSVLTLGAFWYRTSVQDKENESMAQTNDAMFKDSQRLLEELNRLQETIAALEKRPIGSENAEELRKLAERYVNNPDPRAPSGGYAMRAYAKVLGHDFDGARADLAEARRIQPKNYGVNTYYIKCVFAFAHMKKFDDSTEEMERLLEDFPNEPFILQMGAQYFSLTPVEGVQDMKRAQLLMERIVGGRPSGLRRGEMLLYAHTLAGGGKYKEALVAFKKGLTLPTSLPPKEAEKENAGIQRVIEGLEKGVYEFPSATPLQFL